MTLILYQYPGLSPGRTLSGPCAKVHMALRHKQLRYEVHDFTSPMQVKKVNPRGRVPVLSIDGRTVPDSTDILDALEARFRQRPIDPPDPTERAAARILEDWADESLYFYALWLRWLDPENLARMKRHAFGSLPLPLRWFVPALAVREIRARARGQGVGVKDRETIDRELETALASIEALLRDGRWLVGERLSRADLAVAAILDQLLVERLTPNAAERIRSRSAITSWLDRVHETAPAPI